jgi:outer membrane protein assembly factor BamB
MHSDVGHLVDGRTGKIIWRREKAVAPGQFSWGYAGNVVAAADLTGDGCDELINLYPVCFWVADGASGRLLASRELASRRQLPAWAAYGEPMVFDFDGDGKREILLDSIYILALLNGNGDPLWHGKGRRDYLTGRPDDNVGETTATRHALVDLDGDGRPEIASAGYRDGARAIDPGNGKVLWSLEAPSPTCKKCAAADIDGRGGEELLYAASNTLVAVTGDRNGGRLLWLWLAPSSISSPALSDIDGDGNLEILVSSSDGLIYCIDGPP